MRKLLTAALLFTTAMAPIAARASWQGYSDFSQFDFSAPPVKNQAIGSPAHPASSWSGYVGGGGAVAPSYVGSDNHDGQFFPLLNITWKDQVFLSSQRGLGFNILHDNVFTMGAAFSYEQGRDDSDDSRLRGLGDISPSVDAGGFMDIRFARFMHFSTDVKTAITHGGHESTYGNFGLRANLPMARNLELRTGPSLKWASDGYVKRYYGVSAPQSAASGLSTFGAQGGIVSLSYDVALDYEFARRFFVSPVFRYTRLTGDAADSPITTNENNYFAGAFVGYRF